MVWFQWMCGRRIASDGDDDELQETRGNARIGGKKRYGGFLQSGREDIAGRKDTAGRNEWREMRVTWGRKI